jgi:hypothetical protein
MIQRAKTIKQKFIQKKLQTNNTQMNIPRTLSLALISVPASSKAFPILT